MTDPIQPISAHELLRQTATPTPDITAQAQRFEQLMAQSPQPEAAPAPVQAPSHPTSMSNTIQSLDAASRHVVADIQKFVAESPAMDLQTLTSRSMELNLHVATQGLQFTACTSVAQSSKNGLQTLTAASSLAPGKYVLAMDFENEFNTQATSLYRLDSGGDAYAFTQLEADDGREAFPCFDEPAFKHPWQFTLVVPEADSAVTNTPAMT